MRSFMVCLAVLLFCIEASLSSTFDEQNGRRQSRSADQPSYKWWTSLRRPTAPTRRRNPARGTIRFPQQGTKTRATASTPQRERFSSKVRVMKENLRRPPSARTIPPTKVSRYSKQSALHSRTVGPRRASPPASISRLTETSETSFNYSSASAYQTYTINDDSCGRKQLLSRPRRVFTGFVMGGIQVKENNWPWMVSIRVQNTNGVERFLCGGSLITQRHVLTAAHCFDPRHASHRRTYSYFAILGSNERDPLYSDNLQKVDVQQVKIHENYVQKEHYNDIAVLKLSFSVKLDSHVGTVCLPTAEEALLVEGGQMVTVKGWGLIKYDGSSSKALQEATLQILPMSRCRQAYRNLRTDSLRHGISSTMLCAGSVQGGVDACEGDSGGPLVMEVSTGRWVQVGIVSFGFRCGLEDFPGVYTRVSSFVPWIRKVVNEM